MNKVLRMPNPPGGHFGGATFLVLLVNIMASLQCQLETGSPLFFGRIFGQMGKYFVNNFLVYFLSL
jgi:hypothetical protein